VTSHRTHSCLLLLLLLLVLVLLLLLWLAVHVVQQAAFSQVE
jgi:uncharacterized BrkB/YihY/UPF0761 family membrane protein